ncbi:amidase [Janibacter melonis]|uniref:amidase n=1 Tax=Janibacter melonis TaxID=262209 RepID=UPI0019194964|nr:amidase [Janibacter melonis]
MTTTSATQTRVHAFADDALRDDDATGVAARVRSGEISPREAVDAAIARILSVEVLGAVAEWDDERARRRADAIGAGGPGAFHGVPTAIKENVVAAGLPLRMGSDAVPERRSSRDGDVATQLLSTGAVPVVQTTCPPFGWTATTERITDVTRNPWDTTLSSGGSSGGAAALVASGALPFAHGNDGGGSIRIPAAACGLVGLKTTRGRLAGDETTKGMPVPIVVDGVLTRTVRDTARYLAAAERHRPPRSLEPVGLVEEPVERRLRVGVLVDSPLAPATDAPTAAAVRATGELLAGLGHDVEDYDAAVPLRFKEDFLHYWSMLAFGIHRNGPRMFGAGFDRDRLDPFTLGLSRRFARKIWQTPYTLARVAAAGAVYDRTFGDVDVVVSPVLTHTTPPIGYLAADLDFETHLERVSAYVGFTPLHNVTGAPAISLPLGSTEDGTPVGVMVQARRGADRLLLELALELEAARPFARIQD